MTSLENMREYLTKGAEDLRDEGFIDSIDARVAIEIINECMGAYEVNEMYTSWKAMDK